MMCLLLTRSFLLLLLVCDWAGDPYHGQSPLSQPRSSQIYCCPSIGPLACPMARLLGLFPLVTVLPTPNMPLPSMNLWWMSADVLPSRIPATGLLYVYMSLQR